MSHRSIRTLRSLKDLVLDPKNANRGTDRGQTLLATSLQTYQLGRSILVDRLGRVIAGNKVTLAALAQERPLRVIRTRGQEVVAVQRIDLDLAVDPNAQALAIADNRVAELDLEWNVEVLKELQAEGLDLSGFWTDAELASLFETDPFGTRGMWPRQPVRGIAVIEGFGPERFVQTAVVRPRRRIKSKRMIRQELVLGVTSR